MKTADMLTSTGRKLGWHRRLGLRYRRSCTLQPFHLATDEVNDGLSVTCRHPVDYDLPGTRQRQPLDSLRIKIPHDTLRPAVKRKRLQLANNERKAHIKLCCRPLQSGEAPKLRHQGRPGKDRGAGPMCYSCLSTLRVLCWKAVSYIG